MLAWVKRFTMRRAAMLTVVSHAMQRTAEPIADGQTPIHVIPMGVDLKSRFVPPTAGYLRRKKSLLFAGRLVEKKGVRFLIEALPLVVAKHPEARLTIIGSGPDRHVLEAQATRLGVQDKISFLGAVVNTALPSHFQDHEVVVFPSIVASDGDQEGFGLVLVEALGCGCAVISSDLPAMADIIKPNETGIVVSPQDPAALAAEINALMECPAEQKRLSENGRVYVASHFDWSVIANKYSKLFEQLVSCGK
jgi:glycosyltransferase involved in cell wall biosynthesis